MSNIILYHASPYKHVCPTFDLGEENRDYGKGFYITENLELAKEWSVCNPAQKRGWVHCYRLDINELKILDFQEHSVLNWIAELMKHRNADDSRRYQILSKKFIAKYGIDTAGYDVIKGWRANASYFYIAKEFVRDNIDLDILEELLSLGNLGIQYWVKSPKAYSKLQELTYNMISVDFKVYNPKYNQRDQQARLNMKELVNSERNQLIRVFSKLIEE